jgi:hypothetical protein
MGLCPRPYVDLEDSPCREVCSIPHTRVYLFGGVKAFLKGRNEQIEWGVVVGVAIEPSNGTRKVYIRVDGFGVGDVSEDPANTAHIVRVLFPKGFQVPYTYQQPWTISR